MAVTQISRIQVRRGRSDNLPNSLEEGEIALTTDTGEVFIGAPNFSGVQHRDQSIYPYKNIRILTEFDVVHTLSDHIVTHGPLQRITAPQRSVSAASAFVFKYAGLPLPVDGSGNSTIRQVLLSWSGTGNPPADLRGRIIQSVTMERGVNQTYVNTNAFTVKHSPGISPNSQLILDLDDATNLDTVLGSDTFEVQFLNMDTVAEFPLSVSDSFVMNYSIRSEQTVNDLTVRRTGTLTITADEYTVGILDNGIDINQDSAPTNYMRVAWSGHIEDRGGTLWIVLTLTNASYYPVSITFAGSRWAHNPE